MKFPELAWLKAVGDEATDKMLKTSVISALGAVLTALGRQLTDSILLGQVLQSLFTALVVFATPIFLVRLMRRAHSWLATALVVLGVEAVLLVCGSLLIAKHVDLAADPYLERDLPVEARFNGEYPRRMRKTTYNQISVVHHPLVVTDRDTHVLFDFLWTKRDGPARTYVGRVELTAVRRRTTGGAWAIDPFVVHDMSLAPKEGWIPYLFGWFEAPWLLAETEYFAAWTSEQLQTP